MYTHVYAATVLAAFSAKELEMFLGGLFKGLLQDDHLDQITACLKDEQTLQQEMTEAVSDFEKKDLMDIVAGVKIVGSILTQVEGDIVDCKGMEGDAKRIENWAQIFKNPKELVSTIFNNALANRQGLANDVTQVAADATSQDFNDMGLTVADIITKTVGAIPTLPHEERQFLY